TFFAGTMQRVDGGKNKRKENMLLDILPVVAQAAETASHLGGSVTLGGAGIGAGIGVGMVVAKAAEAVARNPVAFSRVLTVAMLEERRRRIEEAHANSEKIKKQLAEAEERYQEILTKANTDAQKMLDEARTSASILAERRQQQAVSEAEQILAKAREATQLEH